MWLCDGLFIHYPSDVHLKCFLELATVNKIALKLLTRVPWNTWADFLWCSQATVLQAVNIPLHTQCHLLLPQSSQTSFWFAFLQLSIKMKAPADPYLIIFDIRYKSFANLAHRWNLMVLAYIFMTANELQYLHKHLPWMCLSVLF